MVFLLSGTNYLFFSSSSLARSSPNYVFQYPICLSLPCFLRSGHLWNSVRHSPLFQAPPPPPFFQFFLSLSLPNFSLTLPLGFPGLCSVSNLYHLAGSGVFDEEPNGRWPLLLVLLLLLVISPLQNRVVKSRPNLVKCAMCCRMHMTQKPCRLRPLSLLESSASAGQASLS